VSFVTDPNGTTFGYGVVARGGTAMQATAAPAVPPAPSSPRAQPQPPEPAAVPAARWTRAPRLDEADPCRGFFPRHAVADVGRVAVEVVIEPEGRVASATVADESPPGDGFGEAARACLRTKTFSPALGPDGLPVRAKATVRIRFSR
jgi:TonB family protein